MGDIDIKKWIQKRDCSIWKRASHGISYGRFCYFGEKIGSALVSTNDEKGRGL